MTSQAGGTGTSAAPVRDGLVLEAVILVAGAKPATQKPDGS